MACDWNKAKYLPNHMDILSQVAKLGEGSFGDVVKTHDKKLLKDFAAKTFKKGLEFDFIKEVSALRLFNHPHIIKINRILFDHTKIPIMILPLVDGDLSRMINEGKIKTHAVANALFVQLVGGMHHIQNRGFMHLDLKPGNILCSNVQKNGMCHLQIADFGLAHKHSGKANPTVAQTLWYRCPEICLEFKYYDMSADTFSIGLIYLEMLTQDRQTSQDARTQVKNSILIAGLSSKSIPPFWKSLPKFKEFQQQSYFPYMQREFVHNEDSVHDTHKLKTFRDRVPNVDELSVAILTNLLHLDFSKRFLPDEKTCQSLLNPRTADRRFLKFQPTTFAFTLINNNVFQNLWSFSDFYKTQQDKIRRGEVVVPESLVCDEDGVNLKFRLRHIKQIVNISLGFNLDVRTILAGIGIFDRLASVRCLEEHLVELLVSCCMHISCCLYEVSIPELRAWVNMAKEGFEVRDLEEGIRKTMYCLKYDMYRPCLIDTFQFGAQSDNERRYIELLTLLYYMIYNTAYLTDSHVVSAEWEKGPVYIANLILADAIADANGEGTNPRDNVFRRLRYEMQAYAEIKSRLTYLKARSLTFYNVRVKSSTNAGCNLFACNIIHDDASMPPLFEETGLRRGTKRPSGETRPALAQRARVTTAMADDDAPMPRRTKRPSDEEARPAQRARVTTAMADDGAPMPRRTKRPSDEEARPAVAQRARTTRQSAKRPPMPQPAGRELRPRALAERALAFWTH